MAIQSEEMDHCAFREHIRLVGFTEGKAGSLRLGTVPHTWNLTTWEVKAGGLRIQDFTAYKVSAVHV